MKKILSLFTTILFIAGLALIYSCSDEFLTKEPYGTVLGTALETTDGVESLLATAYQATKGRSIFGSSMGADWVYGSIASDDAYKGTEPGDQSACNDVERWTTLPSNPYVREKWRDCYNGVFCANLVLEYLDKVQQSSKPFPEARAKEIKGEALTLRAWFHFQANKVFEKIPYIKTQAELGNVLPENVPNTSPCWDEIEADLQEAINNLPTDRPKGEKGRIHKYAAEAIKAQVHMYQNEFDKAKPLLDDILNSAKFNLVAEYGWNFDMTHENNAESIFELQCSTTSTGHTSMMLAGAVKHQKGTASCGGWGFYQPSQSLFEAFQVDDNGLPILDPNSRDSLATDQNIKSDVEFHPTEHPLDPRVDYTIARRGIDYKGWGIHPGNDWIRLQENGGPFMTKKFMQAKSEQSLNTYGTGFYNGLNFRLYRLSHIILWRAEVAVEDNDLVLARSLVNQIRNRAKTTTPIMGLCTSYKSLLINPVVDWTKPAANYKVEPYPDIPADAYPFDTKENARKAVREEIRLEFATEGYRFYDLRRWGIIKQTLDDFVARDVKIRIFMQGAVYEPDRDDYWPLPQDQLDIQRGVLTQDPGYGK
ncbi:MAG TPA: RagB/SusD family nutrient uptake outer membrane protein [Bacteroidales bacterium]|nr:RagB/SusD family nutrient uptake outer membrane protein [Bacteroidales bacterium]HRC88503.1 RagB/SusD family nutrient uptake outer membrane protein [Bacteroidales bacterium]